MNLVRSKTHIPDMPVPVNCISPDSLSKTFPLSSSVTEAFALTPLSADINSSSDSTATSAGRGAASV